MIRDIDHRFSPVILDVSKANPARTNIAESIVKKQRVQVVHDIKDWRSAVDRATSIINPQTYDLMQIYKHVDSDGHVTGIVSSIKNKIKAKDFEIVGSDGKELEDETDKFNTKWYFRFIDLIIEAQFYGYSLVELGKIEDDGFPDLQLVPRENVIPQLDIAVKDAKLPTSGKGDFHYLEHPLNKWLIFIGNKGSDLGLYNKAAPHTISKRGLFAACWQYAELFGMPFRHGKTDIRDTAMKRNMEKMLDNIGKAGWAVTGSEDEIDWIEASNTDAWQVYIEPIKLSNEEISKAFAGQSGAFDEKSFEGAAKVHERLFQEHIRSHMRTAKFVINDDLIPIMMFHGMLPAGSEFRWLQEETLTTIEKAKIIKDLSPSHRFSAETVTEEIGIEVEDVEITESGHGPPPKATIMNDVRELYKDFVTSNGI